MRTTLVTTSRISRRGFTFVELVMGMTITAMIGAALATFTMAVSKSWTDGEQTQSMRLQANQASLRIMPVMQDAKITGRVRAGSVDGTAAKSATAVFWASDDNQDGAMQLSEIKMIQHNTADHTIDLYEVQYPSTYTSADIAWIQSIAVTTADLNNASAPETFKTVLKQIKADHAPRALAAGIVGARFEMRNLNSDSQRPRFVYTLKLQDGNSSVIEYGTATLRGSTTPTH